jgi:hypothetical protein
MSKYLGRRPDLIAQTAIFFFLILIGIVKISRIKLLWSISYVEKFEHIQRKARRVR